MSGGLIHHPSADGLMGRRAWLGTLFAGWAFGSSRGDEGQGQVDSAAVDREARDVEAIAKAAGLGPFRSRQTAHFLGIGNASSAYCTQVLQTCETFLGSYLDHFRRKGFDLGEPKGLLTVVTLTDVAAYGKFMGGDLAPNVTGVYNAGTNRIIVFDVKPREQVVLKESPWVTNLSTLAHELTHQLAFNTGLLSRGADISHCIGEGLALYGEVRGRDGRAAIGQMNFPRLNGLWTRIHSGEAWIPLARLLQDDELLQPKAGNEDVHLAYALSWLLVHYLMTDPVMLPRFRKYLEVLPSRRDAGHRIEDATEYLGRLDRLEKFVQAHARRLTGRGVETSAR